jgi:putative ABC transport system permease protein
MISLTLRNAWSRKGRLVATIVSILLGVAFLTGTLTLTSTLRASFDDLFSNSFRETDVVVQGTKAFTDSNDFNDGRTLLDAEVVERVRAIPGVKAADPGITGLAQALNANGKLVSSGGAPPFGYRWGETDELNPYDIVRGAPPRADDEIVIDALLEERGGFEVGETIKVLTKAGTEPFVISGVATFGAADSAAGATGILFADATAQRVLGEPGTYQSIAVLGNGTETQEALRDRVRAALGDGVEVKTGQESLEETQKIFRGFIDGFGRFLSAFALIAVLVGSFVIYNSFAILVAQRTREMALMRAIGAGRWQVTRAQLVEALIIGLVASTLGLLGGLGVALALRGAFNAAGLTLPERGLVVRPSTLLIGIVLGVVVTLLSAIVPSLRAGRVRPLAAMREQAIDRSAASRPRRVAGVVMLAITIALLVAGELMSGNGALWLVGTSFALGIVTAVVIGPVVARPVAKVLGGRAAGVVVIVLGALVGLSAVAALVAAVTSPALVILAGLLGLFAFGLVQSGLAAQGTTGRIARENARRNPTRTSTTALALTIGVAIVAGIGTLLWSLIGTFTGAVRDGTKAPYLVASSNFIGFPAAVEDALEKVPGITATSSYRFGTVRIDGDSKGVAIVNTSVIDQMADLGRVRGNLGDLADPDTIAIAETAMENNGWTLGQNLELGFANGTTRSARIAATYENQEVLNNAYYLADAAAFAGVPGNPFVNLIWVQVDSNAKAADIEKAADAALAEFPSAEFVTKNQFVGRQLAQVGPIFGIIGLLLAMSFLIAMIGIANTIKLSTLERTHELGLLRAVGMQRGQVRSMIRWEAIIVALLGTAIGLVIGIGYGAALVSKASSDDTIKLSIPWFGVPALSLLAMSVGLAAAARTGRKAAKIDVLDAIATA